MRKIFILFLASVLSFILVTEVTAQSHIRSNDIVVLDKNEIIENDYFAWGGKVITSGRVKGDAFIAGGYITVDGTIDKDLLIAGGNVSIPGTINGSVRVVGGNVTISGKISGNLTVVGGAVNIDKAALISGSLASAAGDLEILGPVGRNANIAAGNLSLNSKVGSDINAAATTLTVSQTASISGNLTYWSDNSAIIAKEAFISGKINRNYSPHSNLFNQNFKNVLTGIRTSVNILTFITTLIFGVLFILLLPNFTKRSTDVINSKFGLSLGIGFLALFLTPIIIVLLFLSIIGLPLGIILLFSYLFLIFITKVFASVWIGQKILALTNQEANLFIYLIIGLIILSVLNLIPILGWLINFFITVVGIGGFLIAKKDTYLELRRNKEI